MGPVPAEVPTELPDPSPALCALRMLVQAHLRTIPRRKGARFLDALAAIVESEESVRVMFPARPRHQRVAISTAQDEAAAWLRHVMPELVRSLPPA